MSSPWRTQEGAPFPLGATWIAEERAYNFAVYSKSASSLTLRFYTPDSLSTPGLLFEFDPFKNKSEDIWHGRIVEGKIAGAICYSFHATSPPTVTGDTFAGVEQSNEPVREVPQGLVMLTAKRDANAILLGSDALLGLIRNKQHLPDLVQ